MTNDLLHHVNHIVEQLEKGFPDHEEIEEGQPYSAYDYLFEALDIQWTLNNNKTYRGARILVTCGGPNIWIDTTHNNVEGYWGTDRIDRGYQDNCGLDDAAEEIFGN